MSKILKFVLVILMIFALFANTANAKWAYMFVVYNGSIYIISDTEVDPKQIGSEIGEVTRYSDMEGTYSGNFSNRYSKGTKYYEINGIDKSNAIAVKEKGDIFIKAAYGGKYAGSRFDWGVIISYTVGILVLLLIFDFIRKRKLTLR